MKTADIPVIELSGAPRERGRIYGETARPLIARVLDAWRENLGNFSLGNTSRRNDYSDSYLNDFFSQTNYLQSIERWAPELLEEVKGIAEGAGQDLKSLLCLQWGDEEWVFGLQRNLNKPTHKCTAFGLPNQANGVSFSGQNMDVPSWVEGTQVLLRIMADDDTPEALIFAYAGTIGLNGVNASSLGVTCNTLVQLKYSTDGLPVSFIVRSILQRHNMDDAVRFLKSIRHASGQNYILSAIGDIRCYECCATSAVQYAPEEYQGRIFHSNHPLVNPDEINILPSSKKQSNNSYARLLSICDRLGDTSRLMDIDDIKAALSAHDDPSNPVSRNINPDNIANSIGYTAGSSIYELGAKPRLHLAAGPPCQTKFEVFEFSNNDKN